MWAGTNGLFDDIPVEDVLRFEAELLEHLRHNTAILTTIAATQKWDDDTAAAVRAAIEKVKAGFKTSAKAAPVSDNPNARPLGDADVDTEQIVVKKG